MIDIRAAQAADANALAALRAASLIEQRYLRAPEREAFVVSATVDFARLFAADRLVGMLLVDDSRVVGSACATYFERLPYPEGSIHAELSGVYVEPAYRRAGHASRLIAAVVEAVRGSAARKTYLRPAPAARSLYARLGFVDDSVGVMSLA